MSPGSTTSIFRPQPPECPEFEYGQHPERWRLRENLVGLLRGLGTLVDCKEVALDTRPAHECMFAQLTPPLQPYYAGHYRGEPFHCLQHYKVAVQGDPRVGADPSLVLPLMHQLDAQLAANFDALDANPLSEAGRLRVLVHIACEAFVTFLGIHPYANGNGHAGRLIVWCILGNYGHWPVRWSVEPRPVDPPYTDYIRRYRDGDRAPLESYIASMLA